MALDDQIFIRSPLVLLGPRFFYNGLTQLDYVFCMSFREAEHLHPYFDFHYVGIKNDEHERVLEILHGWGVPVQSGELFTPTPKKTDVRRVESLLVSAEVIHSQFLAQTYRLTGRKIISEMNPESVLSALSLAAIDPSPDAVHKHLREVFLSQP